MAQEKYGFFDSSGEDIRSYSADDMATAFRTLASNGVVNNDTNLQVTVEGSTMRTIVGYGSALVEGYYYKLRDDGGSVQAFEHTTEASLNRIDRIVIRLDYTARTVTLVKLIGTAASSPEAPALTRDETYYELSLAQVYVAAAATELVSGNITDERDDDAVCGLVAPESLRRSTIETLIASLAASPAQGAKADAAIANMADTYSETTWALGSFCIHNNDFYECTTAITVAEAWNAAHWAQRTIGYVLKALNDAKMAKTTSDTAMKKGNGAGGLANAEEGTDFVGIVSGKANPERTCATVMTKTASYTLILTDAGKFIPMSSTSALTLTIPLNASVAFPVGTEIEIMRYNTGTVTIAATSGVTLLSADSLVSIAVRYASVGLKKIATDTWLLTGYLA